MEYEQQQVSHLATAKQQERAAQESNTGTVLTPDETISSETGSAVTSWDSEATRLLTLRVT